MLKIEEYVLAPTALRGLAVSVNGPLVAGRGNRAIDELWGNLDVVLRRAGHSPVRRYGLLRVAPSGDLTYVAAVADAPELPPDLEPFTLEGGYYLCAEHRGSLEGLGTSMSWLYDEYLSDAPYVTTDGWFIELYDPRFDAYSPTSIMTFGRPVKRLARAGNE